MKRKRTNSLRNKKHNFFAVFNLSPPFFFLGGGKRYSGTKSKQSVPFPLSIPLFPLFRLLPSSSFSDSSSSPDVPCLSPIFSSSFPLCSTFFRVRSHLFTLLSLLNRVLTMTRASELRLRVKSEEALKLLEYFLFVLIVPFFLRGVGVFFSFSLSLSLFLSLSLAFLSLPVPPP